MYLIFYIFTKILMFVSIKTEMLNKEGFFGLIKRNYQQNKGIKSLQTNN